MYSPTKLVDSFVISGLPYYDAPLIFDQLKLGSDLTIVPDAITLTTQRLLLCTLMTTSWALFLEKAILSGVLYSSMDIKTLLPARLRSSVITMVIFLLKQVFTSLMLVNWARKTTCFDLV